MSRRPVIFLSVACSVVKDKWRNSICPKLLQIAKEKTTFQKKNGLFVACVDKKDAGEKGKIQGLDESALFQ